MSPPEHLETKNSATDDDQVDEVTWFMFQVLFELGLMYDQ